MKISTKGRYALRLMLDLAVNHGPGYVSLRGVSSRQDISDKYLEQIIHSLTRIGYVQSSRGAQGGYRLTKAPEEYTLGMILRAVEGSLAPVACLDSDKAGSCHRADKCPTLPIFKRMYDAINDIVDNTTLADLMKDEQAMANATKGADKNV